MLIGLCVGGIEHIHHQLCTCTIPVLFHTCNNYDFHERSTLKVLVSDQLKRSPLLFIGLEAKGSNCILIWLEVNPFCLSTDDYSMKVFYVVILEAKGSNCIVI